jgi:choline kinase
MLAAGDGGRLGAHTRSLPKPLVRLHGRRLVDYTLDALVAAGVTELVVVTGYREAQVIAALEKDAPAALALRFVTNVRHQAGASLSLRAARAACADDPFLLVMSDHLLSAPLLRKLVAATPPDRSAIAADYALRDAAYTDEATKLAVAADGSVTAIGKQIASWQALDTGAFLLRPSAWDAVDAVPEDCELSVIFGELARRGGLVAVDVSRAFWYDIDTAADLEAAAALLALAPTAGA